MLSRSKQYASMHSTGNYTEKNLGPMNTLSDIKYNLFAAIKNQKKTNQTNTKKKKHAQRNSF